MGKAIVCLSGLFDPFTLEYGDWAFTLFGIPRGLMPPVVDSAGDHFGSVHPDIFGCPIPIKAVMADQVGVDGPSMKTAMDQI